MPRSNIDQIAQSLRTSAALVQGLPPTWAYNKDKILLSGPNGQRLGFGLPGHGIVLDQSLKGLGITRRIPGVYERPAVERMVERLGGRERLAMMALGALGALDMHYREASGFLTAMAFTSYDSIINARAGGKGEDRALWKIGSAISITQSAWAHMFTYGGFPSAFVWSTGLAATAPNKTTNGSLLQSFTNPSGGDKSYLLGLGLIANTIAMQAAVLTDVLYECGGFVCNTTSPQAAGAVALTRYTDGLGVMASLSPTTLMSTTAITLTLTYTNTTPTGSRSATAAHVNTSGAGAPGRIIPTDVPFATLQAGDLGITSLQSVTLSATLAAGVFSAFLHKPLCLMPGCPADLYVEREMTSSLDGLVELVTTSGGDLGCPMIMFTGNTSSGSTGVGTQAFLRTARG